MYFPKEKFKRRSLLDLLELGWTKINESIGEPDVECTFPKRNTTPTTSAHPVGHPESLPNIPALVQLGIEHVYRSFQWAIYASFPGESE